MSTTTTPDLCLHLVADGNLDQPYARIDNKAVCPSCFAAECERSAPRLPKVRFDSCRHDATGADCEPCQSACLAALTITRATLHLLGETETASALETVSAELIRRARVRAHAREINAAKRRTRPQPTKRVQLLRAEERGEFVPAIKLAAFRERQPAN